MAFGFGAIPEDDPYAGLDPRVAAMLRDPQAPGAAPPSSTASTVDATGGPIAAATPLGQRLAGTAYDVLMKPAISAATLPGDVYAGRTDPMSDEGLTRAAGLAGLAMTGGVAGTGPGGVALGSGPIRAYHGSPHDFDRFDLSKIGTGEGAQAYGHGLYFAENEGVARGYRDALGGSDLYLNGKKLASDDIAHDVAAHILSFGGTPKDFADTMTSRLGRFKDRPNDPMATYYSDLRSRALEMDGGKMEARPGGRMYEVGINADPAKMLDYDAAFRTQPQAVQDLGADALKRLQGQGQMRSATPDTLNGQDVVWMLGKSGTSPAQAAATFRDAGVPGVRYLDAGSRYGVDKTSNYVMFDDKLIDILRKYGVAGMAAVPPAVQFGFGPPQEQQ